MAETPDTAPPQGDDAPNTDTLSYADGSPPFDPPHTSDKLVLERGVLVDRYVLLGKVGEGGMGAVYAAYDPDLDRKVAIKFLHSYLTGSERQGGEQARLLREAQAMAKLSHPNVAAVYDVGTYRRLVYIAMEFVDGQTFREWMDEKDRTWDEVWPILHGAGRGLEAAHAAGIIHRDFKPDNILVDKANRARVTDFGLARPSGTLETSNDELEVSDGALHQSLTHTGAIMGTPRYMAPEQHTGGDTSHSTDQFAFSLVLFEAAYGERAFRGDGLAELARAVTDGAIVSPKRRGSVPSWRHQALERGLQVDPAKRFDCVGDLLAALDSNPRAQRNRIAAATVVVAMAAAAAVMLWPASDSSKAAAMCTTSSQAFESTWNDAKRQQLKQVFAKTDKRIGIDHAGRVVAALDTYAASWISMHESSCKATHIRGDQSPATLDLRAECLNDRAVKLAGLVDVLTNQPSPLKVRHSVKAALALPSVVGCTDTRALRALVPLPQDINIRREVASLEKQLAKASALDAASDFKAARKLLTPILKRARELGYASLIARALELDANILSHVGETKPARTKLLEAAPFASEARDDQLVAKMWINIVQDTNPTATPGLAKAYATMARAAVARAGSPPALLTRFKYARAVALADGGKPIKASELAKQVLALREKNSPGALSAIGRAHDLLAVTLRATDTGASMRHAQKAIDLFAQAHGPNSHTVAVALEKHARTLTRIGHFTKAATMFRRAVQIHRKASGIHAARTLDAQVSLGRALSRAGNLKEADGLLMALVAQMAKTRTVLTVQIKILRNAALNKQSMGDLKGARALSLRAVPGVITVHGKNHLVTANLYSQIAELCIREEDLQCAHQQAKKSTGNRGQTTRA